jgi:protein-S-isoprenylcysteine O-methyltransferase Ste14
VGFLFLGTSVIPLLYILTPWLEFAKYSLPTWVGWFAISLLILGLSTLRKAHLDLGYSYSQDLEIKEGHTLVTEGIYKYLRHPMYTAGFLIAFAQMGLLQNWIAGLSGIVALGLFYSLRVPKEEEMLQTHFGEEYAAYREKTGGHFPFW